MESIKESNAKPEISDFKLGKPLGEGNFSRIMLATHTATGEQFALKVIEKQRVKRLRVRHPNIFNEINMEKEVLNKLRHPNIIRLYHTFQDEGNLYFLLKYEQGGELLTHLIHDRHQVGVHEDLARFYLADIVNAIEYMHANQIMHRDLKPENMVVCALDGHLKLIDFGTAKDLASPALNGPNFVGTPEYMAPETIDNKDATYASDIWSLGCIAFQLLAGETPFSGGSAYLTFLKVQNGAYHIPSFLSEHATDFIAQCVKKNPQERLTIAAIKGHPFFNGIDFANHMKATPPATQFQNASLFELIEQLRTCDQLRVPTQPLQFEGDALQATIDALPDQERSLLMHLLERKQVLHLPSVYPRFFAKPSLGRCLYARHGGYVGLTHGLQNQWSDTFTFMMIRGPALGKPRVGSDRSPMTWEADASAFRESQIIKINAAMPAFVVFCGDLIHATPGSDEYADQASKFHDLVNDIHPEIKLVFVPGVATFAGAPSVSDAMREIYATQFGDDRFSFWYGGLKFIVINSSLIAHESEFPDQAHAQEEWLVKELDNGKLCAKETIVFSAHSFHSLVQGPELPPHLAAATHATADNNNNTETRSPVLSTAQKKWYVDLLAKTPPRLIVTTQGPEDRVVTVHTALDPKAADREHDGDDEVVPVKKTEMVVVGSSSPSKSQSNHAAVIHVAQVTQSGVALSQIKTNGGSDGATKAAAAVAAPEDVELSLAKLEISREAGLVSAAK